MPLAAPVLAAIIGGGASLIGQGINAISNRANNKRQMQLIDEERAYNSPLAQMQRLKAAGLNPALAYQGGANNTSQGIANTEPTKVDLSGFANAVTMYLALKKADLDIQGKESDNIVKANNATISNELMDDQNWVRYKEGTARFAPAIQSQFMKLDDQIQTSKLKQFDIDQFDYRKQIQSLDQAIKTENVEALKNANLFSEYDKQRYIKYEILPNEPKESQLLKMFTVEVKGQKLSQVSSSMWERLRDFIGGKDINGKR